MHLFSASTSAVVGSAIDLANSLLANCNSMRSADKYASLMTLERYHVASCGEDLIERELSLGRFLLCSLLYCLTANLIFLRALSVFGQLRSQYALAPFQTVAQFTVSHGSEIVPHTRQGVVVSDPMLRCVSRVNVCSSLH